MSKDNEVPIIGQEAVCPDGLGRVMGFECFGVPNQYIQVSTYFNDRQCKWARHNVQLVPIQGYTTEKKPTD